ncbi:hypothetical protein B0A50_06395 [Salinomyces thailandicus]|uniref:Uncharacterized protein n=1 Tax=Salinomyces thailandicus TaxID=706561 RepID=A0A4U0TS79_9PEZI|nr:hypothetical protein B0A50_06395 [Salinomyces thailandica]
MPSHSSALTTLLAVTAALFIKATAAHKNPSTMSSAHNHALQNILNTAQSNPLYTYPTDFTQDIQPKPFHSHNDYWRPLPFYTALAAGATSIEADVWLHNSTLYVGHDESSLSPARTLESLYINPLLDVLARQNPTPLIISPGPDQRKNGVFDTAPGQTMNLLIDLKTDGAETWPYVLRALEPLRQANYLTTYKDNTLTSGPITVIGTGNTPLPQVQAANPRDAFYDAKLPLLSTTQSNLDPSVAPLASTSFGRQFGEVRGLTLNATQTQILHEQISVAHSKGMDVRYWDQPEWPVGTRNAMWRLLWDAGVDYLNVDDLEAAAGFWEMEG